MALQPTLLPEGTYTEVEQAFIESSPPGLWPDNQNSNFGQVRKVFCDILQDRADEVSMIMDEHFVKKSSRYLSLWEDAVQVPVAPAGKTDADRRSVIAPRLKYGAFTKARVTSLIEGFLGTTFGAAVSLTPAGVALSAGGVPLFSGASSTIGMYRVYYDYQTFTYRVWLRNDVTPNVAAMTQELTRAQPAGWTLIVDNTKPNVLSYLRTVLNKAPVLFARLGGNANDDSGYGTNGTVVGAPASIAGAGLLVATGNDPSTAYDLNGSTDYFTFPVAAHHNVGDRYSIEAWVRPDALSGTMTIINKGSAGLSGAPGAFWLAVTSTGQVQLLEGFSGLAAAHSSINLTVGQTYFIAATKNGPVPKIYIDGVDRTVVDAHATDVHALTSGPVYIGRRVDAASNFWNGALDEVSLFNEVLSPAQVLQDFNTGKNIAT